MEGGSEMVRANISNIMIELGLMVCLAGGVSAPVSAAESRDASSVQKEFACGPTTPDSLGPFYKPDAPLRNAVGEGYVLQGVVRSAVDCSPIANARIEFWLAGPNGNYDDGHRAATVTATGEYRFESNFPPSYASRPPHIHIRVSAGGYRTLVTQHYPKKGTTRGSMDLVLVPEG
jgi:protocatechuate 3,4-dioxygenase beta subunit